MDRKKFLKFLGVGIVAAPFAGKAAIKALFASPEEYVNHLRWNRGAVNVTGTLVPEPTNIIYNPKSAEVLYSIHGDKGLTYFELLEQMGFDVEKFNKDYGTKANQEGPC